MKLSVSHRPAFGPRSVTCLLLLFALVFTLALPVFAEIVYPTPTDYIADDAAVLSEQTVKQIKEKNADLASEIKAVIAVCTVKSTNGIEIGKYARSLYSEWKLPTGILLVVASEDKSFFLVPSTGVSEVIDNTALEEVRDQYIEDDFAAGRIDTAIRKAVTQLSILMLREMKQETAPAQSGDAPAQTPAATDAANARGDAEEKGTSLGGIIVGILKTILIIALILLALFVILFIAALFNDDVAAIMQKYVFRRGRQTQNNANYYDDRLYGRQDDYRQQQRNPRPNNYNQGKMLAERCLSKFELKKGDRVMVWGLKSVPNRGRRAQAILDVFEGAGLTADYIEISPRDQQGAHPGGPGADGLPVLQQGLQARGHRPRRADGPVGQRPSLCGDRPRRGTRVRLQPLPRHGGGHPHGLS